MFRGHHLMLTTSGSGGITWSWKQQLVGVNRTGGISWTIMKNMKIGKFTNILNINKQVRKLLFFLKEILITLSVFIFFMIFQPISPFLLTPTNFCFHDQVITSLPGVLGIKWWPLNIGICVYWKELRNVKLSFTQPGYRKKCETNRCFLIFHSWKGIRTKTHWLKN